MEGFPQNRETKQVDVDPELRHLVQKEVEARILGSNPADKYQSGTLSRGDSPDESYVDRVNKLVKIALKDPNSPEMLKAKQSMSATFKPKETIEREHDELYGKAA